MTRILPREALLYARLIALAGIFLFVSAGGQVDGRFALLTVALVCAGIVVARQATLRRGERLSLAEWPLHLIVLDLAATASWVLATALNPRSVSFVLILAVAAIGMYARGRTGAVLAGGAYLLARVGQEALRIGAGAPTPPSQLLGEVIVVTIALTVFASIAENVRAEQARTTAAYLASKTAASTDSLTGLPNRRVFFERLEQAARQAEEGVPLAVAVVDVDLLKQVNDGHGHAAGDEALVRIGEILAAGVRADDLVARTGGDEFAIVFAGAPVLAAERIMRRLVEEVGAGVLRDGRLPTIAWGVAAAGPGQSTPDELVDAADRAMYRQKERTRRQALA